ncbi:hypothetical protein H0H92_011883 [Tricholoma furcatifolium]|nr:hypothetical protein H0H92_011883 [Tricholoma furcatifolium]
MERRSKRIRAAPEPKYNLYLDSDDSGADSEGSFKAPKTKKPRKSATDAGGSKSRRMVRGKRGKLEQMAELPLDVLFEIFGQLEPIDILNLSRTSKSLRNILMSRSSIGVWRNARAHVEGLPECPDDMSEPAYANLVFYPYCHRNIVDDEN